MAAHDIATSLEHDLRAVLRSDGLRAVYQPIVCLDRLAPVGVEALVRGPAGTPLESPAALFRAAGQVALVPALDQASRRAGLRGAVAARLADPAVLFLNAEPQGLGAAPPPDLGLLAARVQAAGVRGVLEITERALTHHPAELLRAVQRVRDRGWRIALDDVGADRASLALLPLLAPDVVKLDLRLVQQRTTVEIAEIVNAVLAHAERTGAVVLAEGIETAQHLALARSMGATLGQGWLFGRPGALDPTTAYVPMTFGPRPPASPLRTPWDFTADGCTVRTAEKRLLVAMSMTLERHAAVAGESCVVIGSFQHRRFFTPRTAARYRSLAGSAAFVAALGVGLDTVELPGVRTADLDPDDALVHEWDIAVVGPHFAGALLARGAGDGSAADGDRRFDYVLTYDRDTVLAVTRALLGRVPVAEVARPR